MENPLCGIHLDVITISQAACEELETLKTYYSKENCSQQLLSIVEITLHAQAVPSRMSRRR